ncbi:YdcF family protein [Paenibacillus sp. TRM 82003]|uniref:YdcF family protein n=1 Tax=Kineococcus sp. TRM81007 TaxID=2925831 RepID=UPI001F58EE1D|nr:YdcF family protein [Kineococcus sp. TRM81007]MCI2238350.1 YdcF family protein [Kineococcus sp. TRM81007]MCI3922138.1 YdcF family protein [Paenibacillus sp. TRM 82003]
MPGPLHPSPPAAVVAALAAAAALPVVAVLVAELVQWRASRRGWDQHPHRDRSRRRGRRTAEPVPGPQVVLVLGCPSRPGGRVHPVQRWRTEIAVRSLHPQHGRLLFSGGRTGAPDDPSEACVMAAYARDVLGVPEQRIALEEEARSTWQNVAHCLDQLEAAGSITIASAPTHAARARRYLAKQRPGLAQRLTPAQDYRVGERRGWKVATVAYALARKIGRALPLKPAAPWQRPDRVPRRGGGGHRRAGSALIS